MIERAKDTGATQSACVHVGYPPWQAQFIAADLVLSKQNHSHGPYQFVAIRQREATKCATAADERQP